MTTPTNTDPCGQVRVSLFYGAPIFSEVGACAHPTGHEGDYKDPRNGTWSVVPFHPMTNTGNGAGE